MKLDYSMTCAHIESESPDVIAYITPSFGTNNSSQTLLRIRMVKHHAASDKKLGLHLYFLIDNVHRGTQKLGYGCDRQSEALRCNQMSLHKV